MKMIQDSCMSCRVRGYLLTEYGDISVITVVIRLSEATSQHTWTRHSIILASRLEPPPVTVWPDMSELWGQCQ